MLFRSLAVGLAALGVLQQLWQVGSLPWLSLALAGSFAFYGLIRKQAPVVVTNLLDVMAGNLPSATYLGYTSCPLVTGYGKLVLAEFDYNNEPMETFPFDQSEERWSMYQLKKQVLPRMYWSAILKGIA